MYILFYFISNLKLIALLFVYLIFFEFDEAEPLFSADNLDNVEKTLITEVMVIEDYIVFEQIRKLVLHNFPNFLLRHGMNPRSWCLHPEGIYPDISYYLQ